jgi:hypothetical protein
VKLEPPEVVGSIDLTDVIPDGERSEPIRDPCTP